MGVVVSTKTYINPGPMIAKLQIAYRSSVEATELVAKAGAPGKIGGTIHASPVGVWGATIQADAPYAAPVESGAKPHIIAPSSGTGILANKGLGFVSGGPVKHPGMAGRHFMAKALAGFRTLFVQAGRRLF